jgi:transposase
VFKFPIQFESLSFTSCTEQKQNVIHKNKVKGSIYNAYITLSGQKTESGKIIIPVKYSRDYHGNIDDYYKLPNKNNQINVSYTVTFQIKKNRKNDVKICLTRMMEDTVVTGKTKYYGIDTNVKHNMFCDKNGKTIDYDRDVLNDYVKFLKKCDEKLQSKPKEKRELSNRDKKVKRKWNVRIKNMLKKKSSLLVDNCKEQGKDHLVMEDLSSFGKSFVRSDELLGFKYSRLVQLLNLSNLKNIIMSIGNKNDVQVTHVQSAYTSISCRCGCVDKENRKTQEEFKCISCGLKSNADTHSAGMIEDRLAVEVLRQSLLEEENGVFTPKKLKRPTIKKMLSECYDVNNQLSLVDR